MPSRYEVPVHIEEYTTDGYIANLQSTVAVMVTHPWGPLGGNMYNNVVNTVVLYFQRLGITTFRFNFAGTQFGRGYYQVEQLQFLSQQLLSGALFNHNNNNNSDTNNNTTSPSSLSPPKERNDGTTMVLPKYILLIGYSYGSLIASSASATIPQCIGVISIAPPLGVAQWLLLFHSNYHLEQSRKRQEPYFQRLFLLGSHDNFTSESKLTSVLDQYYYKNDGTSSSESSSTKTTSAAILKDADHFFIRREKDIMDVIGQWLITTAYRDECHNDLTQFKSIEINLDNANNNTNVCPEALGPAAPAET